MKWANGERANSTLVMLVLIPRHSSKTGALSSAKKEDRIKVAVLSDTTHGSFESATSSSSSVALIL
jgi:CRISPR/Cas system type I-B associated protein Csh2 (Cas7 group RAMP superfamily)